MRATLEDGCLEAGNCVEEMVGIKGVATAWVLSTWPVRSGIVKLCWRGAEILSPCEFCELVAKLPV